MKFCQSDCARVHPCILSVKEHVLLTKCGVSLQIIHDMIVNSSTDAFQVKTQKMQYKDGILNPRNYYYYYWSVHWDWIRIQQKLRDVNYSKICEEF